MFPSGVCLFGLSVFFLFLFRKYFQGSWNDMIFNTYCDRTSKEASIFHVISMAKNTNPQWRGRASQGQENWILTLTLSHTPLPKQVISEPKDAGEKMIVKFHTAFPTFLRSVMIEPKCRIVISTGNLKSEVPSVILCHISCNENERG